MISFPTTPINGQIFSTDQYDYIWNESTQKWLQKQSNPSLKHRLLSDSASINLDLSDHSSFEVNIKGQSASPEISFSNPPAESGKFTVKVKNDYDLPKTAMNYSGRSHNELTPLGGVDAISTAGIAFSSDGTRMFMGDRTSSYLHQFDLTTPWDIQSRVYNGVKSNLGISGLTFVNVTFSHDGKHYFIMNYNTMFLYRIDLSTPWDLSTASYNGVFLDLGATVGLSDISSYSQVQFNINAENPGNKMFFILRDYTIYEVEFLTPYDLPNAVYSGTNADLRTVTGLSSGLFRGFTFDSDGSRILLTDVQSDRIVQINTQAPYTIAGSLTFDTNFFDIKASTSETTPHGIYLKPDETKLFMAGYATSSVHEIDIADNWTDPSDFSYAGNYVRFYNTAPGTFESAHFSPDGKTLLILTSNISVIYQFDLRIPWDIDSMVFANKLFDLQSIQATSEGLYVSPDGTHLFTVAGLDDQIEYFQMVTPWDVATLVHISSTNYTSLPSGTADQRSVWFTSDGSRMFLSRVSDITWWDLATSWDISTATYVSAKSYSQYTGEIGGLGNAEEIAFSERGDKLYFLETDADTILSVELSTPWDPSTGTIAVETVKHASEASISYGFAISRDSDKIFLLSGADNNTIFEYEIGGVEDTIIAAPTFAGLTTSQGTATKNGIFFKPDGLRVWYNIGNTTYQANLTTPWDIQTIQTPSYSVAQISGYSNDVMGIFFSSDGYKFYTVVNRSSSAGLIAEVPLAEPWVLSTAIIADRVTISTGAATHTFGLHIDQTGTKLFVSGNWSSIDRVHSYTMKSWNLSTLVYVGFGTVITNSRSIGLNAAGTELYTYNFISTGSALRKYTLSTPWDTRVLTLTATYATSYLYQQYIQSAYFKPDLSEVYFGLSSTRSGNIVKNIFYENPYTIQWPDNINWENNTAPEAPKLDYSSVIDLYTTDGGTTYSGIERVSSAYNPNTFKE